MPLPIKSIVMIIVFSYLTFILITLYTDSLHLVQTNFEDNNANSSSEVLVNTISRPTIKQNHNTKENPFRLLDAYRRPDKSFMRKRDTDAESQFDLHTEQDYCDSVDSNNLANPDNIFRYRNFFTNFPLDRKKLVFSPS